MDEVTEKKSPKISIGWIAALIASALIFIGLAMPLIATHGATYDPATWGFEEAFERRELGAAIMFGLEGAVVWPYFLLYGAALIGTILLLVAHFDKKRASRYEVVSLLLFLVAGVMFLISNNFYGFCNAQATVGEAAKNTPYFEEGFSDNYYWYIKTYIATCDSRLGVGAIWSGALCFIAGLLAFSESLAKESISVREMTEIGLLVAASVGLDVLFHFIPNVPGFVGSISIALLPLYIVALRHGPAKAFLASSILYGIITCFTDGYGFFLYPLDYFVGYAGVAVLGFFRPLILKEGQSGYSVKGMIFIFVGVMLGSIVRFIGSGASSMVNYGYTFLAALVANAYIFISAAICAVILMACYGPLQKLNAMFPLRKGLADE